MSTNNGGPAFPGEKATRFGQTNDCNEGMTLRDYFAAKAMQGMSANPYWDDKIYSDIAKNAYSQADEMIAARGDV